MIEGDRLLGQMFNIGIRARDIPAERDFLNIFRPNRMETIKRTASFGPSEVTSVEFGESRFFLFDKPVYEDALDGEGISHSGGLSHVSFMVESTEAVLSAARVAGVKPLLGPYDVTPAGHGKRRVAFFVSPNGTIFESQELLRD